MSRDLRRGASGTALAGAYVGSVIGAGFASGQEHTAFFLRFGPDGLWGLTVAGLMFILFGAGLLLLAYRCKTRSHAELLRAVAAPPVAFAFDGLLSASLLASLSVMMAGSGALMHALLGIPPFAGALVLAFAALAIVLFRVDVMLRANTALTGALIALIAWVAVASLPHALRGGQPLAPILPAERGWTPPSWIGSAVLYGSYNLALTLTLFGSLGSEIRSAKDAWIGGIAGGALLFLLSLGICFAVAGSVPAEKGGIRLDGAREIPMLWAAARLGPAAKAAYSAATFLAMLTTAVASAYALARRLAAMSRAPGVHALSSVFVVAAALPLSSLGFGRLVATLYPVIGYAGAGTLGLAALLWARSSAPVAK